MDKEMPRYEELNPQNNIINMIISQDRKSVSNLYKVIHGRSSDILYNICSKLDLKASLSLNTTEVSMSFIQTNMLFDDVFLRYIQFRTLHHRFFTNDMLIKCNIKQSDVCDFCNEESDSNLHMIISCNIIQALWQEVRNWISDFGEIDYELTDEKKILGDTTNKTFVTIIIMHYTPQKSIIQFLLSIR